MPSSGQGTSFAIENATVLGNCLLKHGLDEEDGDQQALKEYAKTRVKKSKQMAQYAALACEVGLGRTWYWRMLRDTSSLMIGWSSNP